MNFLFVARSMAVMNSTKVGGGVRSTLMIEALSKLGHVDIISFVKEPVESNLPNCDVVFNCSRIGSFSICICFLRPGVRKGITLLIRSRKTLSPVIITQNIMIMLYAISCGTQFRVV